MKIKKLIFVPAIILLLASVGYAEVTQHKSAPPVNSDGISTTINRPSVEKSAVNYKKDQLRCWQDGDLIVVENNWRLGDKSQARVLYKGKQKLYFYDFGATFCIFIED